jgi:hypothetical protein
VIVLVGLFTYLTGVFGGPKITPFIDSVYAHHAGISAVDCPIKGTCRQVQEQLASALEKEIVVPNLDDIDYRLGGAKGDLVMEGSHCAVIKYDGDRNEVSHFVICCMGVPIDKLREVEGNPDYRHESRNGVDMIFWRCDKTKTTRCVAGECPVAVLLTVAQEIRLRSKAASQ